MSLRQLVPDLVKQPLRALRREARRVAFLRQLRESRGTSRAFFLLSVDESFPNLGDQAMAVSNALWLASFFGRNVLEVPFNERFDYMRAIEETIRPEDWIFLHSGGNLGDMWPEIHPIRLEIVSRFTKNRIVQLPQTVYFSDSPSGLALMGATQAVFRRHRQLTIIARDPISFGIAKSTFPVATVLSCPDTALLLDSELQRRRFRTTPTSGAPRVLVVMRNDREGIWSEGAKNDVLTALKGYALTRWDTEPMQERFVANARLEIVMQWLQFIAQHDAVVTDRFHGLIFAVLTRRPCVLLPTGSHKISGALDWFRDLPFLRMASSTEKVSGLLREVLSDENRVVPDWQELYFKPLMKEIGVVSTEGHL